MQGNKSEKAITEAQVTMKQQPVLSLKIPPWVKL
jgi:hypothetical protein